MCIRDRPLPQAGSFSMLPGRGVCAEVLGKRVLAGSRELLQEEGVEVPLSQPVEDLLHRGCTLTHVAADGKYLGCVALSDTLREESAGMIKELKELEIDPVLLTGDNQNAADSIAQRLGISMVHALSLIHIWPFQSSQSNQRAL